MTTPPERAQPGIRPVAVGDRSALAAFYAALDDEARGSRFLGFASVAVAADWRRMGLGRRLVDAGLEWARDHHVPQVTATAFATNAAVLRLLVGSTPGVTTHPRRGGIVDIDIPVTDA